MNSFKTYEQPTPQSSPWSLRHKILMLLWSLCWNLFCAWTPKPLNKWRLCWLKIFGAKIYGTPFVHQTARIQIPWHLTLHDKSCLGDRCVAYTLGEIEIFEDATIAQEVYLCTGTHDFTKHNRPLMTSKITVNKSAFIGARATILPGITIGRYSVVGACSLVTKNVEDNSVVAGNPARFIRSTHS